jgi:hypothetical protein
MNRHRLHIIDHPPEQPTDIQALNRADILKRDWARVMIDGDKGPAVSVGDGRKRIWRG